MNYRSQTISIRDILTQPFDLPSYQRDYVWTEAQALELVGSLIEGYPIGNFTFMQQLDTGDAWPPMSVVDGQQRISTIRGAQLGNGGRVHKVSINSAARPVIGTGPGLLPIWMVMVIDAHRIAASGGDPLVDSVLSLNDAQYSCFTSTMTVWDRLISTSAPCTVFNRDASPVYIREAFRRINATGTVITGAELEMLLGHRTQ